MDIVVRVDARGFAKLLQAKVPTALARGLNEGGDKVRTQVRRALKDQTGLKAYKSVTSRTAEAGVGGNRAAPGRMAYRIVATGKGIPIKEFPVKVVARGVDAKTWGVDHLFKRSFGVKGRGIDGLRARLGPKRFPIRRLYGPSLPKELVKDRAAAAFYDGVETHVAPAVLKRLAAALA